MPPLSGRTVVYTLKLNSDVSKVLMQTEKDALKLDNTMWQLQKTLSAFGVGLGAHYMIDAAKEWTQGAADFEIAMLRIKNASSIGSEIKNQLFITDAVDRFKVDLQSTLDFYGTFLFKIKNANLSDNQKNTFFNELTAVGKIAGLSDAQMTPVINNVGTMLAEGILEARHLRQLSYSHPQVLPFLAHDLGLDANKVSKAASIEDEVTSLQRLSQLMSSGKLTKAGVNSNVLIQAFHEYYQSVENKLPETLTTVQSYLNELSNTWLNFKNSMVLGQKPELIEFFHNLENSIKWLADHEEGIIKTGKAIFEIVKLYAEWRIALVALQAPFAIVSLINGEYNRLLSTLGLYSKNTISATSTIINQTAATKAQTYAIYEEVEAIDILNNAFNGRTLQSGQKLLGGLPYTNYEDVTSYSNKNVLNPYSGIMNSSAITNGLMNVFIAGMAIQVADQFFPKGKISKNELVTSDWLHGISQSVNPFYWFSEKGKNGKDGGVGFGKIHDIAVENANFADLQNSIRTSHSNIKWNQNGNELYNLLSKSSFLDTIDPLDKYGKRKTSNNELYDLLKNAGFTGLPILDTESNEKNISNSKLKNHILAGKDTTHIRGNSSNYVTIHIQEMNGIKGLTQKFDSSGSPVDEEKIQQMVGIGLTKILTGVVNDSQLVGHHK